MAIQASSPARHFRESLLQDLPKNADPGTHIAAGLQTYFEAMKAQHRRRNAEEYHTGHTRVESGPT